MNSKYGLTELLQQANADDHTTVNSTTAGAQQVLNLIQRWLDWTKCMKAKPSKCRSLALLTTTTDTSTKYGPTDPLLTIGNTQIPHIGKTHFKFLGRNICYDLNTKNHRVRVTEEFETRMRTTDGEKLSGTAKVWIYNNYVMSHLAWPFTVYDFPVSTATVITKIAVRYLKKWLNIRKPASPEIFFLPEAGLKVKNPITFLKTLQIGKCHILRNSMDPSVRFVAEEKTYKALNSKDKRWRPENALVELENSLIWEDAFLPDPLAPKTKLGPHRAQNYGKQDLKSQRKMLTKRAKKQEYEKMRIRLFDLCQNGYITTWDKIMSSDITWKDMIYDLSDDVISFRINAISRSLPCPSNLRRWGLKGHGRCPLCAKSNTTAAHILSNCYYSLREGRYTWRHDNVLIGIHRNIVGLVRQANRLNAKPSRGRDIKFIKAGSSAPISKRKRTSILHEYLPTDWCVTFDFRGERTIPAETRIDTNLRPDITIFSLSQKIIIWLEETIPLECNAVQAALRKTARYATRKTDLLLKGWKVHDLTYEIGALGFIANTFDSCFRKLGSSCTQRKCIRNRASKLALRSSYYIWSNRFNKKFHPPNIVTPPKSHCFPPTNGVMCQKDSNTSKSRKSPSIPIKKRLFDRPKSSFFYTPPKPLLPSPKSNFPEKHVFETPPKPILSPSAEQRTRLSSFSKLKAEVNKMTPPNPGDWIDYQYMSLQMRGWFDKNIPLYEVDCFFDLPPIKNSVHDWLFRDCPKSPLIKVEPILEACIKASITALSAYQSTHQLATVACASSGLASIIAATERTIVIDVNIAASTATAAAGYAAAACSKATASVTAVKLCALKKSRISPSPFRKIIFRLNDQVVFSNTKKQARLNKEYQIIDAAVAAAAGASRSVSILDAKACATPGFAALCAAISPSIPQLSADPESDISSSEDEELAFWLDRGPLWVIKEDPEEKENSIFSIFSIYPTRHH